MPTKWLLIYKATVIATPHPEAENPVYEYDSYDSAWYSAQKLLEKGSYQQLTIVKKEASLTSEVVKKVNTVRYE